MNKSSTNNPRSWTLNELSKIIGEDKAQLLSKHVRHRHFWVPKTYKGDDTRLAKIIGRPATLRLIRAYGGELYTFTGERGYHEEAERLHREGLSIEKIARRFHVTTSRILFILGKGKGTKPPPAHKPPEKPRRPRPTVKGQGGAIGSSPAAPQCGGEKSKNRADSAKN
jgi:hypothetical protein